MKGPRVFDTTESTRLLPDERPVPTVSRVIVRDALANLGPGARISHRVGGHSDQYNGVAVSPDGSRFITANADGTARLWDIASGQCLMVFRGHTAGVQKTAFMNDGERAVTASKDGTLRLWDCATGACILVLIGHMGSVVALAVSPDDRYIAGGGYSSELLVWSLPGGTCEHVVRGIDHGTKILVTRDGNTLLTLHPGRDIQRWSFPGLDNPSFIAQGDYWDIALTGEGEVVAAGGDGLSCFDVRTGVRKRIYSLEPHNPYKVTTTSDETRFVTCCYPDHAILVLDHRADAIERLFTEHGLVMDMTLSPDGKTLCTVTIGGACNVWDIGRGECLRTNSSTWNVCHLALSGNGTHLAACDKGNTVKLWNLRDGLQRAVFRGATSVAFLESACLVATGHTDGGVRFWDVESGNEEPVAVLQAYSTPVGCLLPLGSGASFVTFSYLTGVPKLWDTEKRACIRTYNIGGDIDIDTVSIDEATQQIAVRRHSKNHILVCDLRSGDILAKLKDHERRFGNLPVVITGIRFLPEGKGLVSCGRDGLLILWDLSTFKAARSINVGFSILSMAVEHDGRHVVIGNSKGGVERWDLESGQREICCRPEGRPVAALALSPDERRLFVSFRDGTVQVIDRESNNLLCSLWNVDDGFFWFTPPDEHAPDGWVWTDRSDLLHLVEESSEGKVLGAVPLNDDRRRTYIHTRNNAAMVRARLKGLNEYNRTAGRYACAVAKEQRKAISLPRPLLPEGDGYA